MRIEKVEKDNILWEKVIAYADSCSWVAGKHLAGMMREDIFKDWESVFAAVQKDEVVGFCTLLETDYYPENRYSPWISSIFVDENYRGNRVSQQMIEKVIDYAREQGFSTVYIPSDMIGFYEKYGFNKIDELVNYGGDIDNIFAKKI